jgi:hypothetical protein
LRVSIGERVPEVISIERGFLWSKFSKTVLEDRHCIVKILVSISIRI